MKLFLVRNGKIVFSDEKALVVEEPPEGLPPIAGGEGYVVDGEAYITYGDAYTVDYE